MFLSSLAMQSSFFLFLIILTVWLLAVTLIVAKIFALFRKLTRGVETDDLKKVLGKILTRQELNQKEIGEIGKRISWLENDGRRHIQKIGFVRFNPFRELGGDHSFSLAILDAGDSGIVITSLHTRDRTRVYMKDIKKGKSIFELSSEEKKAFAIAQKDK